MCRSLEFLCWVTFATAISLAIIFTVLDGGRAVAAHEEQMLIRDVEITSNRLRQARTVGDQGYIKDAEARMRRAVIRLDMTRNRVGNITGLEPFVHPEGGLETENKTQETQEKQCHH